MLALIDNYDSFTYNLVQEMGKVGLEFSIWRNDKISVDELLALKPRAIVISPGPCAPQQAGICLDLIKRLDGLTAPPLLFGVCLGHQALAAALGGNITRTDPVHGKLWPIAKTNDDDPLLKNIPSEFSVVRYHSLIADIKSLPDCLEISCIEPNQQIIMGMRHKTKPFYGVQFHPESYASQHGATLFRNLKSLIDQAA